MRIGARRFRLIGCAVVTGATAMLAATAYADDKPAQQVKVFVFVQKDTSGFVDDRTQYLDHSLKDVREAIAKKKSPWMQLVEAQEQADVLVELTERKLVERQGQASTVTTYDKDNKGAVSTTTQSKEHDVVLKAVMKVGDYTNELTGACDLGYLFGGAYRKAATNLVGSLESWIKKNHGRLQLKTLR